MQFRTAELKFEADIGITCYTMDEILDQPLLETNQSVKYGGFWPRLGALIIDGIVLAPVTFGVAFLNITTWKSSMLLVAITIVTTGYKPLMEFFYGATLGKMSFDLKVVNLSFEKACLTEILFRNVFHIVPSLISLVITVGIYELPEFESVSGYGDYSTFLSTYSFLQVINYLSAIIIVVDAIVLLSDPYKRSLHDKIGRTYVIRK